jgi:hypothetical protein
MLAMFHGAGALLLVRRLPVWRDSFKLVNN